MKGTSLLRVGGSGNSAPNAMMDLLIIIRTAKGEVHAHFTVGNDLARSVFAVHGVNEHGKAALVKPKVPRASGSARKAPNEMRN